MKRYSNFDNNSTRIIFHIPWQLSDTQSASQIRPKQMLLAFQRSGFEVDIISGANFERKKTYKRIQENIRNGNSYLFCYSESSTLPTLFASGKKSFLSAPIIDYQIFLYLFMHKIPIGLFLRDIYWRFKDYIYESSSKLRSLIFILAYWCDVIVYRLFVDVLYIPSLNMREYLPNLLKKKIIKDLPPGMSVPNNFNDQLLSMESPIRYIYVGGIGNYYRMGVLFQAIRYFPNMEYFFCFRKDEWEKGEKIYNIKDMKNILIFHYSNAKLPELYTLCHIGLIFIEPDAYRKFAIPYKLFEYLSYGKPVVASKGTAAGDFVQKWNVGWVIPYEIDALIALFARLSENREEINICKKNIALILADNMWDARISRVKYDLSE